MFSLLKQDYYIKKLDETKGDMKKTWKILKNAMNQNIKANSIEKVVIRNTEITANAETVEAFNEHFASVGEKLAAQIENMSINHVNAINKADTKSKFKSIEVCQIIKIIKSCQMGQQLAFIPYIIDL